MVWIGSFCSLPVHGLESSTAASCAGCLTDALHARFLAGHGGGRQAPGAHLCAQPQGDGQDGTVSGCGALSLPAAVSPSCHGAAPLATCVGSNSRWLPSAGPPARCPLVSPPLRSFLKEECLKNDTLAKILRDDSASREILQVGLSGGLCSGRCRLEWVLPQSGVAWKRPPPAQLALPAPSPPAPSNLASQPSVPTCARPRRRA